jgi:LPS sulfotransferase NodH
MKSYIVCCVPRSGSWLLADLLDQTSAAGHPEEYFRPDYRKQWSDEWGIDPEGPYSRYVTAALANTTTHNDVFGVKMHWYQLEWFISQLRAIPGANRDATDAALVEQWLPQPDYVHLHRDDTVRQAISYYRAAYSDRWFHLIEDDEGRLASSPPVPPKPDWAHVRFLEESLISHERRWNEFFARSGIAPLEIRYEDMIRAYEQTLRRVLDFIGVQLRPGTPLPSPRLRKQADEETERLAEEYLAHRDGVEPRLLNLGDQKARVVPRRRADGQPAVSAVSTMTSPRRWSPLR